MGNTRKIHVISLPAEKMLEVIKLWDFESDGSLSDSLYGADYILFSHRDDEGELCEVSHWEQAKVNGRLVQRVGFSRKRDLSVFNLQSLKNHISNSTLDRDGVDWVERLLSGGSARPLGLDSSQLTAPEQASITMDMARKAVATYYNVSPAQVSITISSEAPAHA